MSSKASFNGLIYQSKYGVGRRRRENLLRQVLENAERERERERELHLVDLSSYDLDTLCKILMFIKLLEFVTDAGFVVGKSKQRFS